MTTGRLALDTLDNLIEKLVQREGTLFDYRT